MVYVECLFCITVFKNKPSMRCNKLEREKLRTVGANSLFVFPRVINQFKVFFYLKTIENF